MVIHTEQADHLCTLLVAGGVHRHGELLLKGLQHELSPNFVGVSAFFDELVQQRCGRGGEVGELEREGSSTHLDCIQNFLLVDSRLRLLLQ